MAPRSRVRLSSPVLGALALAASLAACSSTPTALGPTTTSSTVASTIRRKPVCSLTTLGQIDQTMGVNVNSPVVVVGSEGTTCTYKASDVSQSVIIQYQTAATEASFAADKARIASKDGPPSLLPGVGQEAFASTGVEGHDTVTTVVVLSGSLQVVVIGSSSLPRVVTMASEALYELKTSTTSSSTSSSP